MRPYQEAYIKNCLAIRALTAFSFGDEDEFDRCLDRAMEDRRKAAELVKENSQLLEKQLFPLLDDLYKQDEETLAGLEEFADALVKSPKAVDVPLACQLYEALLSRARRSGERETVIRRLYKLGMARYGLYNMLTGLEGPELNHISSRMRYCFVEASSYLKFFEEIPDDETKAYILRSTANIYMGAHRDWHDKLNCVRSSMRTFHDKRFRENAPNLPWDRYDQALHRQMSSAVPYDLPGGSLSPDEVADVMASTQLVYENSFFDVRHQGISVKAHDLLAYYAVEFTCGLLTKEDFMENLEALMDQADVTQYDQASLYQIMSLPVYYIQYLQVLPELIPPRKQYILRLYEKLLKYVHAMPADFVSDTVNLYVRQSMSVFSELEGGLPYRDLLLSLMAKFTPQLFSHSIVVARLTQAICEAILEGDPGYFSDIPEAAACDPGERREVILTLAEQNSLLHDVGMVNFTSLYSSMTRQMLHSEDEIIRCHTTAGYQRLKAYESTRCCADAALGHHRWYDGSDGYPVSYQRLESPYRALTDILSVADFLAQEGDAAGEFDRSTAFETRLEQILQQDGKRFSPMVVSWIRDAKLQAALKSICDDGIREGLRRCFKFERELTLPGRVLPLFLQE